MLTAVVETESDDF